MVSFSHGELGCRLSQKVSKRVQEFYEVECKKPDPQNLEALDESSREAYLIAIEEDGKRIDLL